MTTNNTIQVRRATAAAFTLLNPVLADGEPGYETDTRKIKYGNGTSAWNTLPYVAGEVTSVAGRTGNIVLNAGDITDFGSSASASAPVQSVAGKTGQVTLTSADVSGALGMPSYSSWSSKTIPSASWKSIAYGNGVFVALSRSNVAATSNDGITWTQRTLSIGSGWSVTFGNGLFVAVSSGTNTAATSSDGINWTTRTLPSSSSWWSVTYGNGLFVTVALNSNIAATSPDGITWTSRTLPSSSAWTCVTYGNGVFVAAAQSSTTAASSSDGITWTSRTLPTNVKWQCATYGAGLFVITGGNSAVAATSTDGITWTQRALPANTNWGPIAYGNGVFLALSGDYLSNACNNNVAATSIDGITWTQRTLPSTLSWSSVVWGKGVFVAVASLFSGSCGGNGSLVASTTSGITAAEKIVVLDGTKSLLTDSSRIKRLAYGNSGAALTLNSSATVQTCSLSANCTFTMPPVTIDLNNNVNNSEFTLILTQTGSFTAAFTSVKWPAGAAPTITTGANKVDVIRFVSDGTSWYGRITQNY